VRGKRKESARRALAEISVAVAVIALAFLLDLEAVWCHWCHVMAETTYADDKVAALLKSNN
jgi:uncharacterized protein DUF255